MRKLECVILKERSLNAIQISKLIPHGEAMSLIEGVENWDNSSLLAQTRSHLRLDNPLSKNGTLPSIASIEYAAQCTAIHSALVPVTQSRSFVIGALKNVTFTAIDLSELEGTLRIKVDLIFTGKSGAIYEFSVSHSHLSVASGRLTLIQRD